MNEKDLHITFNGECPYLKNRYWVTKYFHLESVSGKIYENWINKGYRRSGKEFYKNVCPNCTKCIPLRVPVKTFKPSKSQRKVIKKNCDIKVEIKDLNYSEESYELYKNYCIDQHGNNLNNSVDSYEQFLLNSPVESKMMMYYISDDLAGVGWVDLLDNSISSVYYAFNKKYNKRSLGVFSVCKEIELCKEIKKEWLQLGFWVGNSKKMDYKSNYKPFELLIEGKWQKLKEG